VLIAERREFPGNFGTARGFAVQEFTLLWQLALSEKSSNSRVLQLPIVQRHKEVKPTSPLFVIK
jgi:hypothetical protein